MRVGRDVRDPVAACDAQILEGARPAIASLKERLVGQAARAVDDRFAAGVEPPRAAGELERGERGFHGGILPNGPAKAGHYDRGPVVSGFSRTGTWCPASPRADATGVDVHEMRVRVIADAAGPQTERGRAQVWQAARRASRMSMALPCMCRLDAATPLLFSRSIWLVFGDR